MNNTEVIVFPSKHITVTMKIKNLLLAGTLLLVSVQAFSQARVQVIHNSADAAAAVVDVWLNDSLLLDDFAFRNASPFVDAPAGVPIDISIAAPNSVDTIGSIARFTYTLTNGETYVIVANGIVSATGYSPATPFDLYVTNMGRETSANGMMETDVLVFHGSTDAPTVNVNEKTAGLLAGGVSYGDFAGYLELSTADYDLQIRNENNSAIVAAYDAPLSTLSLGGQALVVLASGFLDPMMNSNGAAFGLFVALPSGGALIPLPSAAIPTAEVQVIHNSADAAAAQVDVWLNETLLVDDFTFRTASPFVEAQAGVDLTVSIAPTTSTDTTSAIAQFIYTLDENENYVLVANGIVSATGYSPATPFNIYVHPGARTAATQAGNVDLLVFHGATDAPTVDVDEIAILNTTLVPAISYGEFQGYVEAPEDDYTLEVKAMGSSVASYQAPLATLGLAGQSLTVVASGFLDPMMNSNGANFGLWAATAAGGPLVELPVVTGIGENDDNVRNVIAWPNPTSGQISIQADLLNDGAITLSVMDAMGRIVKDFGTRTWGAGQNRLDLELGAQSNGLYFIFLQGEGGTTRIPVQLRN